MITVYITSGIWLQAGEEAIVKRIARAILGDDSHVARQSAGYEWTLHQCGNDWKTTCLLPGKEGRGRTIEVAWRYGYGGNALVLESWGVVLNHIFG